MHCFGAERKIYPGSASPLPKNVIRYLDVRYVWNTFSLGELFSYLEKEIKILEEIFALLMQRICSPMYIRHPGALVRSLSRAWARGDVIMGSVMGQAFFPCLSFLPP